MSTIESSPAAIIFYLYSVIITVTQAVPVYQDYLRYYVKDYSDSRSIRPLTCRSLDGTVGVCMFSLACRHANGHPIGLCKDTIYSGSCCQLPVNNNNPNDGSHVSESENFLEYPVGTNRTSPKVPIINVSQPQAPSSTASIPSSSTLGFSPSISTTTTIAASITTNTPVDTTTPIANSYPATLLSASSSTSQSTSQYTSSPTSSSTSSTSASSSTSLPTSLPTSSQTSSPSTSPSASPSTSSPASSTSPPTSPSTSPSTLSSEPSSLKTTQQSSSTISSLMTTVTSLDTSEFPTTQEDGEEETKKESMYMIDDGKVRSSSTTSFLTSTSSTQVPTKLTESTIASQSMIAFDAPSSQLTNKPDSLTNPSTASTSSESTSLHSTLTSSTATRTATVSTSPPTTPLKTAPPTPAIVSTLSTSTTTTTTTKSPPPSSTTSTTTIKIPTLNRITSPSTVAPKNHTNHQGIKAICGRKMNGPGPTARIVGGSQSSFSEWPWMVSTRQWKKNAFLHKCGAALLNEYWAITAAHCVENVAPTDLLLRLGEYDISHEDEPFGHIERRVQIIAPHPKFDPRTFEYDLALLRFYEPITFRKNILPICIPEGNKSFVGRKATVTGWGRLYEEGPLPNTLQHVDVPVITNQECEMMYRRAGYLEEIPNIFICAGMASGGKDSCEGDSGGPLVIEENGQWNLIGIISWGIGCALPNQPGVYTRITEFARWIHQIIAY